MTGTHTPRFKDLNLGLSNPDLSQMVKFKLLNDNPIFEPQRGTPRAAGFDCRANLQGPSTDVTIQPGQQLLIGLGFAFQPPEGMAGFLLPRSGLGTKKGVVLANTVGLIDEDYRQEVMACIKNTGKDPLVIEHGERICQLVIVPVFQGRGIVVAELSSTEREGGFGSTGTK